MKQVIVLAKFLWNVDVSIFKKDRILNNKNFLYFVLITVLPGGLAFKGGQVISLLAFIVSIEVPPINWTLVCIIKGFLKTCR